MDRREVLRVLIKQDREYKTDPESPSLSAADFIQNVCRHTSLTGAQIENVSRLKDLADRSTPGLGLTVTESARIIPETIVLESGHQPNFLPHCGTWKKAFMLDRICRRIRETGVPVIAFFGFADQNQSTARLLTRNFLPDLSKTGSKVIGFRIKEPDTERGFRFQEKPSMDSWKEKMDLLHRHYQNMIARADPEGTIGPRLSVLREILEVSYANAENFADLNARVFAKVSRDIFGLDLNFFRYSDLFAGDMFLEESRSLLQKFTEFNIIYNRSIREHCLGIPSALEGELPFWYHCACGRKLGIQVSESLTGELLCPDCSRKYFLDFGNNFESLEDHYRNMDFKAVTRELVVPEALGDSLFIAGLGGSLEYGKISDEIAGTLALHRPLIASWQSKDYYLGIAHAIALSDMIKTFSLDPADLESHVCFEKADVMIKTLNDDINHCLAESIDQKNKDVFTLKRRLNSFETLLSSARGIFSLRPSAFDVFANCRAENLPVLWDAALGRSSIVREGDRYTFNSDICYPPELLLAISREKIPAIYKSLRQPEKE